LRKKKGEKEGEEDGIGASSSPVSKGKKRKKVPKLTKYKKKPGHRNIRFREGER